MFAFLAGWRMYVALGLLAVLLGLGGMVYVQSLRLDVAKSEARALQKDKDDLLNDLAQSQKDKAAAEERAKRADAAVVERDKRLTALLEAERNLRGEYNRIKGLLAQADQDCMDRLLPDAIAARLRDTPADGDKDRSGKSPAGDDHASPQVAAP